MKVSESIDDMTENQLIGKSYDDFIVLRYSDDGKVSLLQMNSVNVNLFARRVTSEIRHEMTTFEGVGVVASLGTMSGIAFLAGIGPEVTLKVLNLGIVDADFSSEFITAGINHTLHRLYMTIVVNMTMILPGYDLSFDNSSKIIVSESVIVGDLPQGVITNQNDALDLLP